MSACQLPICPEHGGSSPRSAAGGGRVLPGAVGTDAPADPQLLRDGERNVGELAQLCGYTAANISRHLALLTKHGLVARESRGTSVYYRIADDRSTRCATWCAATSPASSSKPRATARHSCGHRQEPEGRSRARDEAQHRPVSDDPHGQPAAARRPDPDDVREGGGRAGRCRPRCRSASPSAVEEVVRKQAESGVDIVNDGEMSKPSYATYIKDRLGGFGGTGNTFVYQDLVGFPNLAKRVFGDPGPLAPEDAGVQRADRRARPAGGAGRRRAPEGGAREASRSRTRS